MASARLSWTWTSVLTASTTSIYTVMAQGDTTVSFERISGGLGIGVNNAPVSATFHLPPGRNPAHLAARR